MSYRNALLRPKKINAPIVENVEPEEVEVVVAPPAAAPPNNNNNNNNANWLSRIKINTPEPAFRNVNFPSPPSTPGPNNNNYYYALPPEEELTEEQKRLIAEDPAAFLFLPETLFFEPEPYYIYSQHYGECATDSFLNILFFADGFREYFAKKADILFKRFRQEHRYDLLHYTPYFKSQVIELYGIINGTQMNADDFGKLVDIFARIVRRYIFVMLLNQVGSETARKLSEIVETKCPLRVKPKAVRRKSLNAMAGIDIHDAILEFLGQNRREKKNNSNELVSRGLTTTQILEILSKFMSIIFAPRSMDLHYQWHPFEQTEAIQPYLPFLKAVYLAPSSLDETKAGHAVSFFSWAGKWYLADNNLGFTLNLPGFDPMRYFGPGVLSQFFIYDFSNIRVNELLGGNHDVEVKGFDFDQFHYSRFTIQRLQSGTYYGFYIYQDGDKNAGADQIILAITRENLYPCFPMKEKFDSEQRLYFFSGRESANRNNTNWTQNVEVNPNLPGPFKRNKLKKTKRRPKSKGKRRTTQRAKPPRANQTKTLEGQLNNAREAAGNAYNDAWDERMNRYYNYYGNNDDKPEKPKGLTLGNFF